ncbi:MAG: discoidin domain-containing protein [Fibrobacterota bacterium]
MKSLFLPAILVLSVIAFSQTATLSSFPQRLQLFARDAQDSATVIVTGNVTSTGSDSVTLTVLKNGAAYQYFKQVLVYSAGSAPFTFSARLHAELASYKVELRVNTTTVSTADSVLSGDAFITEGQSNAAGSEVTFYSPWVRTFSISDTAWHRGNSTSWDIGRHIIEDYAVPVCFFNGAVGATSSASHLPDTSLGSIYGKLLFRVTRAGLRNGIKAFFWYQGESDSGDSLFNAKGYADRFKIIHDSWLADCPSIQHFYVFQIRPGCGSNYQDILRDCQRRLPDLLPDVSLMSTTNVAGRYSDNCHYLSTGYAEMGSWMYRLLARDLYGSTDTVDITPPDIQKAWYADDARTQLVLQFDQPVLLPADTAMKRYFSLRRENGRAWGLADSLSADTTQHTVTLYIQSGTFEGDAVSYIPPEYNPFTGANYNGPWLENTRGIGPLTFYNVAIENKDPLDSLTATSMQAFAHDSVLEQYDSTRVSAVTAYSTGKIDTTEKECVFTSLSTFLATVSPYGQVIAKNTGTARIRVSKRGFLDTVSIRIISTTATLDSIRLSVHQKNVALIGVTLNSTGYYRKGTERFSVNLDTVAVWTSGLPTMVAVARGVVKHVAGWRSAPIPIAAALAGVSDTCWMTAPWLVPRAEITVTATGPIYGGTNTADKILDSTRAWWLSTGAPETLSFAFTAPRKIDKVYYLPWQDGRLNGVMTQYKLLYSVDSLAFDSLATGSWANDLNQKEAPFPAVDAKYVRLIAVAATNGYVNADEVGFQRHDTSTTGVMDESTPLTAAALSAAPNPFNPSLAIRYSAAKEGVMTLALFSISGKRVGTLVNDFHRPGQYRTQWNGRDSGNQPAAAGVYVLVMKGNGFSRQMKVTLLK